MYSQQWLSDLQSFLNTILSGIIKKDEKRMEFLTARAMVIWARAFTHETFSVSNNYEDLEFLGDAILKAAFPKYLMKRFKYYHKAEFTELNTYYMSNITHATLSAELGLDRYILINGIDFANSNLGADVFESFFGALDTVSDMIHEGIGFIYCYNMVVSIFEGRIIDEEKARGSAKTQVIQVFSRFDLPVLQERQIPGIEYSVTAKGDLAQVFEDPAVIGYSSAVTEDAAESEAYRQAIESLEEAGLIEVSTVRSDNRDRDITFSVRLREVHVKFLLSYSVKVGDPIIGTGTAPTKKKAEFIAYNRALSRLSSLGISREWAEQTKRKLDLLDPLVAPYIQGATMRMKKEGYDSIYFFISRKTGTKKGVVVQLIGVRKDGTKSVLSSTFTNNRSHSYMKGKATTIRNYANLKK